MAELAEHDRIKLHIGAHRTGTTSLQSALHKHRPNLSARGVGYWGPFAMRAKRFPGIFKDYSVQSLLPERLEAVDSMVKTNTALLKQRLEYQRQLGHEQIILSEENILGSIEKNTRMAQLYPHAAPRLEVFSRIFGPYISRISLTIRSYDEYWRSMITYALSHGRALPNPRQLQAFADQPSRWLDVIKDIRIAFPNTDICVMPFEDWIGRPEAHIGAIFGASLGLPAQESQQKNASKNMAELRADLLAQGDEISAKLIGEADTAYTPFSRAQVTKMQAAYEADLAEIRLRNLPRVTLLNPAETG